MSILSGKETSGSKDDSASGTEENRNDQPDDSTKATNNNKDTTESLVRKRSLDNVTATSSTATEDSSAVPAVKRSKQTENDVAVQELEKGAEKPSEGGHGDVSAPVTQKRPKLRVRSAPALTTLVVDLSPPEQPAAGRTNTFNVSEIIKGFLYIGAGFDPSNRVVTNLPNDNAESTLRMERLAWFQYYNVRFALNMAGSPLQKELLGLTYPSDEMVRKLALDVNDIDEWHDSMAEQLERGAEFIQQAFEEHMKEKKAAKDASARPPSIFVHCVAGVNRSPFVVVWWLVKHHKISPETAWELVRRRRDAGVNWVNQTLGGPIIGLSSSLSSELVRTTSSDQMDATPKKQKWFDELKRRFGR